MLPSDTFCGLSRPLHVSKFRPSCKIHGAELLVSKKRPDAKVSKCLAALHELALRCLLQVLTSQPLKHREVKKRSGSEIIKDSGKWKSMKGHQKRRQHFKVCSFKRSTKTFWTKSQITPGHISSSRLSIDQNLTKNENQKSIITLIHPWTYRTLQRMRVKTCSNTIHYHHLRGESVTGVTAVSPPLLKRRFVWKASDEVDEN